MRLGKLLKDVSIQNIIGDPETEIEGLAYDSRLVKPGYLFVALKGRARDGHDFVKEAVQRGAAAVVVESEMGKGKGGVNPETPLIEVSDSRKALAKLSVNYYESPFEGVPIIGITGTNGKTTTSYLLESILLEAGVRPGIIGTINYRFSGKTWEAPVTTPESLDLMKILKNMTDAGVSHVVMEVSSHALDQGRVRECPFRVAIFTNISRDHLDYHQSMDAYFNAKSRLFRDLSRKSSIEGGVCAVINGDDPKGMEISRLTDSPILIYGLGRNCDVRADHIQATKDGLRARLTTPAGHTDIHSHLIGDFNIYNILAATAGALCLEIGLKSIASGIAGLKGVPGRLEMVKNGRSLAIVVDYAHTPDALRKALGALKPLVKGRVITVFGCGGDRDRGKRHEMGMVAGRMSDLVVITSDNPRTEEPAVIAMQIEKGIQEAGLKRLSNYSGDRPFTSGYFFELDRKKAIEMSIKIAGKKDLILIAGKGHEDYQIVGTEKRVFDDRKVAAEAAR
jgi:UDP-N-acetylmuramoyl-L-alanyl-D-glutamate--2,6-diaminopimelate ligase